MLSGNMLHDVGASQFAHGTVHGVWHVDLHRLRARVDDLGAVTGVIWLVGDLRHGDFDCVLCTHCISLGTFQGRLGVCV